ncbi:MAG: 2-hydroxyacid dehydrogenase [Gammaproteobacteria bacterium]|nr:2-hydroxyacid dehydrogenase [Gammaproteobacteria bacterium]
MKITFFSTQKFETPFFDDINKNHQHQICYLDYHLNETTVSTILEAEVVCCFVNDIIDQPVIDALKTKGVKLIALRSAGYNHVDYQYAQQQGIKVCHVPTYSPHAVAEHTMALILSLNRKIPRAHNRVKEGDFSLSGLMGFDLYQKTVGIIGTGNIGFVFAQILQGFGCKVLAYDIAPNDACLKLGVNYVSLETLLKKSQIISLHCPLNAQTKHIINKETIALMQTGVMLINTSRGQLIHTKNAIDALKSKKLGYLGIDVYEEEGPLFFDDHSSDIIDDDLFCRLQTFPNVLITGHQGFFTQEAVHNIAKTTLENVSEFEKTGTPVYPVTELVPPK